MGVWAWSFQDCITLCGNRFTDTFESYPSLHYRKHALWGPDANWATPGDSVGTCVEISTKSRRSEDGKTEFPSQTLKASKQIRE